MPIDMSKDLLKAIRNYEDILLFGVGNSNEEEDARKQLINEISKAIDLCNKKELELLKHIIYKYEINEKEITKRSR